MQKENTTDRDLRLALNGIKRSFKEVTSFNLKRTNKALALDADETTEWAAQGKVVINYYCIYITLLYTIMLSKLQ